MRLACEEKREVEGTDISLVRLRQAEVALAFLIHPLQLNKTQMYHSVSCSTAVISTFSLADT